MQKPFVIGISGGSGSGKSTIVNSVCEHFSDGQVSLLTQDDFYHPKKQQALDDNGITDFDRLDAINHDAFHNRLLDLIEGKEVNIKEYVFNNDKATAKMKTIHPAPVVIAEGLFVFNTEKVKSLIDLKIFIEASDVLKVIRRIKRDQIQRNYPLDDVLYRYEHHVLPSYEKYIAPTKLSADLVINNNKNITKAVDVLINLIKGKLSI